MACKGEGAKRITVTQLQEQLLDAQDRIGELEEINERQRDDIAALEAELAARPGGSVPIAMTGSSDAAMETLKKRIEELEKVRKVLAASQQLSSQTSA